MAMTNIQFYNAVIEANLSDEITEKAKHLLEVNSNKSSKRMEAQSANRTANIALAQSIAETIGKGTTFAISEIADSFADYTKSKLSAVCKVGVEEGIFTAIDNYKVGGKGRAVKGYTVV